MNKDLKKKIIVGILVTVGTALFVIGIFLVGSKQDLFNSTFKINTVFKNVGGLRKGDFVRLNGVKIGVIDDVAFINDTAIRVDMRIQSKMNGYIHKNVIAAIASDGLVGNKLIDLKPVSGASPQVNDGDQIASEEPMDMGTVYKKLISSNEYLNTTLQQIQGVAEKLNSGHGLFNTLISDTVTDQKFKSIVGELQATAANAQAFSGDLKNMMTSVKSGKGVLGTLIADTAATAQLKQSLDNIQAASVHADSAVKKFSAIMDQAQNKSGTFGMVMSDTAMANDVKQSVINIKESSARLNEDLEAMKHNFLLRGYFKKQARKNGTK